MSTERKNNTLKRDQALNDATNGQLGEEPRQVPLPGSPKPESDNITDSLRRTARKMSRDIWFISLCEGLKICPGESNLILSLQHKYMYIHNKKMSKTQYK
jgi:hypothetical protein